MYIVRSNRAVHCPSQVEPAFNYFQLLLTHVKAQICFCCRRQSVRCPFRRHISKNKQDRPIVTVVCYSEDGTTDSVAAFRSSPDALMGRGDRPFSGKTCHPISERYRLALSVSTANDLFALAWQACQLFIAVAILLFV